MSIYSMSIYVSIIFFIFYVCFFSSFNNHHSFTDKPSWAHLSLSDTLSLIDEVMEICQERSATHGLMSLVRSLQLGDEVVRRILLGTLALSKTQTQANAVKDAMGMSREGDDHLYKKAKRTQALITHEMNSVYKEQKVDFMLWFLTLSFSLSFSLFLFLFLSLSLSLYEFMCFFVHFFLSLALHLHYLPCLWMS